MLVGGKYFSIRKKYTCLHTLIQLLLSVPRYSVAFMKVMKCYCLPYIDYIEHCLVFLWNLIGICWVFFFYYLASVAIIAILSISPHISNNSSNDQISIDMCKNKIIFILYLHTSVICVIEVPMNAWMRNVIYAQGSRERESNKNNRWNADSNIS